MSDGKGTLRFFGDSGKEQTREINFIIDIRDYRRRPGFPWLVMAANPYLSVSAIWHWLISEEGDFERSTGWIYRRRWLFQDPEKANGVGGQPNADGKDRRALEIMRENPTMSARALSRLLKQSGIQRGKDWVLKRRCG